MALLALRRQRWVKWQTVRQMQPKSLCPAPSGKCQCVLPPNNAIALRQPCTTEACHALLQHEMLASRSCPTQTLAISMLASGAVVWTLTRALL